ncbi:uncharacterized protein GGS22DRAFT_195260 [Annulohypoxylon maeteangense]|uniref:uncharacterized protein n=1 Tax=Annulohypoxylon maeteangense TaxID=1927788 RepID=UPI0020078F1C|nr:uncharacterized protein GGS22DRAFT_195260 [Annulohypoxylon maeteangense]KAI0883597.1 hypothetical protein GGS22DRAFT_195260 [Annulohypoxylon maeteangense]
MTTEPGSPKRRHILSSINPDRRSESPIIESYTPPEEAPPPHPDTDNEQPSASLDANEETTEAREKKKTSKFRFKSKKTSRSHRHSSRDRDRNHDQDHNAADEDSSHRRHRHRHHHHHHRHKRRRSRSPTPPNPFEPQPLDTESAFRESLFDAMADDEGAAYWQNVYGQPIHVYPNARAGPDGELERMDDDEYAAFVRQRMWEKTHAGLLEERARREEMRKKKKGEEEEARRLTREMERSLRRGEERRRRRGWRVGFEEYLKIWTGWDGRIEEMGWPVRSGRREDVSADAVRDFFILGIDAEDVGEAEFLARLKEERVRWHPDKIQQRVGGKVDEDVMRDVTAVFQIVDKLWSDTRSKRQ